MPDKYDYTLRREATEYISLSFCNIGDLVWYGSIYNIGNINFIGIIIDVEWEFGYSKSLYKIYTNEGVFETRYIFPMEY